MSGTGAIKRLQKGARMSCTSTMSRTWYKLLPILAVGAAIAACSTTADYNQPISSFSDATDKAGQALEAYNKAAAARATEIRKQDALARPRAVRPLTDKECATNSTGCQIAYFEGNEPKLLVIDTLIPQHLAAMREINSYAKALKDVAGADSTPAVKTAVEKAGAAISSLASIAAPGSSAGAQAFAVPVEELAVWIYGKYQEHIKLKALRDSTSAMERVLPEAVKKFGTAASFLELVDLRRLDRDFNAKSRAFDDKPSPANLDGLIASASSFDQALRLSPQDIFQRLGQAHTELSAALRDESVSLAAVFQSIDRLSADAETLKKIAEAFQKAAATP